MNFDLKSELEKFNKTFKDLSVDISLFDIDISKEIVVYLLENYSNYCKFLIKNGTFIQTIYPYIELAYKKDSSKEQALTLFAQDFQNFSK